MRTWTPTLDRLIKEGLVRVSPDEYYGYTPDGTAVSFGCEAKQVEQYLKNRPNPEQW